MTDSPLDNWEVAVSRLLDSSKELKLLLGEDWVKKIWTTEEGCKKEVQEQYKAFKQSFKDIRSCMRPTTMISGIENEEDVDLWRDLGHKDSYPVLDYLKTTIDHYEDFLDDPDCAEMLTILINLPFFNPDHWLKKEDELPPLYIKGAGIPPWLSKRYREAVYSYIYGFNNAAIALCRSIIEGVIRKRIGDNFNNKAKLEEMIDFFVNTVKETKNKQAVWGAHKVRTLANDVLHDIEESVGDNSAKGILLRTRNFIKAVY